MAEENKRLSDEFAKISNDEARLLKLFKESHVALYESIRVGQMSPYDSCYQDAVSSEISRLIKLGNDIGGKIIDIQNNR